MLKAVIKEKYPHKKEEDLLRQLEEVIQGPIEGWQWRKIIEKMYDDEDFKLLEQQLLYKIQLQQQTPSEEEAKRPTLMLAQQLKASVKAKLTRGQRQQLEAASGANKLRYSVFLKTVLDFQLREHERFLAPFVQEFRNHDTDKDGVLDEQ